MSEYNRATKPVYWEDVFDIEQNWDDLEKHDYHNYTFDFYYGQHDKWEKNLSDFLKKNNINLENVDFGHFHPEDPSGSIYFSDDGGNDYRMSDHWSESYVPTGTKVLHIQCEFGWWTQRWER